MAVDEHQAPPVLGLGAWVRSFPRAARDLVAGRTRCTSMLVGRTIRLPDGQELEVFRDTRRAIRYWGPDDGAAVLVPRFHLRLLGPRRRRLHALFRVACIGTTPFFVGLRGFRSKLWMVDHRTGDFAGVYEWDDEPTALAYAEGLARILRRLSTAGSVSYEVFPYTTLGDFLETCTTTTATGRSREEEATMNDDSGARAALDAARREEVRAAAEDRLARADDLAAAALETPPTERAAHRIGARSHATSAAALRRSASLHRLEAGAGSSSQG